MKGPGYTRREFGKLTTGIIIAFSLAPERAGFTQDSLPDDLASNPALDSWLRIGSDGKITIFTGKVELGQGILTAFAQIAADELDAPLDTISLISGDTAQTPDEKYTTGSQSIEKGGMAIRYACAQARSLLVERASQRLGVTAGRLKVQRGSVISPSGKKVTYGELAQTGVLRRNITETIEPKKPNNYHIVGKPALRLDIPSKATGEPVYVQDIALPGMTFGRVVRPFGPGKKLISVDTGSVRSMPGIIAVIRDGSFLGVIASREEQAIAAREMLKKSAKWEDGKGLLEIQDVPLWLQNKSAETNIIAENRSGTNRHTAKTVTAVYTRPYTEHASIGPSCAVAEMKNGKLHVWSHTQGVYQLREDLAHVLHLKPDQIRVSHVQGSGCYGHNGADDVALDAAILACAAPGRPVKVQWMRDDEFTWEPFGSAMVMKLSAGLTPDGRVVTWQHDVFSTTHNMRPGSPGGINLLAAWHLADPSKPAPVKPIPPPFGGASRNEVPLYDFPNQKITLHFIKDMPLRTSALRSLGAYANIFALESFIDELAHAAQLDPVKFRLNHLKDRRARAVIELAVKKAPWRKNPPGGGRGQGFAFARYKNHAAYVACVAEATVNRRTGEIAIPQITAAVDAGQIINPKGLEMQIEGGIIQSASWTLKEAVKFDRKNIISRDWLSYPILRFPEIPKVNVYLVDRSDEKPLGAGEASMGPAAAAIANAVANALGRKYRLRDLPLTPDKVLAALSQDKEEKGNLA